MAKRIKVAKTINGKETFLNTARKVRKRKDFKKIEKLIGKKEYKKAIKEIEYLQRTGVPRCIICGAPMVNDYDSISKEINPYLWKTTCEHFKHLQMSIG